MAASQASLLLQKQLRDLCKNPVDDFSAGLVDEDNVFEWSVSIIGPPDTLYIDSLSWFLAMGLSFQFCFFQHQFSLLVVTMERRRGSQEERRLEIEPSRETNLFLPLNDRKTTLDQLR
ncbi:hypothetical protein CMV_021395 [Castanea mollissima]|uniref:UBC core domain-containing protein n=1 Tax=Castanea mollissima TaxID=60419 RepID=A0A8J4QFT8_9ROSI|nr:hypothetical protein CMV_021395 [Castanea mollissima]